MPDPLTCMAIAGHPVEGVLHVGVREGQDLPDYRPCGASPCIYVEPMQAVFDRLVEQFHGDPWHIALSTVCSDEAASRAPADTKPPSTAFDLSVPVPAFSTVDDLIEAFSPRRPPNLLVLDARGAELLVLRGAAGSLPSIEGVYVAVNETRPHPMACELDEIQSFLKRHNLHLRWLDLDGAGVGHAFFSRRRMITSELPTYNGNLALNKAAYQSSLSMWSRADMQAEAGGAINGEISGEYGFHTEIEDNPWWLVDLGEPHHLREIRIYNRVGQVRSRARTLRVITSEDGAEWWEVHDQGGYTFGGADGRPLRVLLDSWPARYVALRLAERAYLHLDEVEIY